MYNQQPEAEVAPFRAQPSVEHKKAALASGPSLVSLMCIQPKASPAAGSPPSPPPCTARRPGLRERLQPGLVPRHGGRIELRKRCSKRPQPGRQGIAVVHDHPAQRRRDRLKKVRYLTAALRCNKMIVSPRAVRLADHLTSANKKRGLCARARLMTAWSSMCRPIYFCVAL